MEGLDKLMVIIGNATYGALAIDALLGAYYVIVVWFRLASLKFRKEQLQHDFLAAIQEALQAQQFDHALQISEGDRRVLPQLVHAAIANRGLGFAKAKQAAIDIFQRDVLADLEYRMSWINTVIKTAPMLGLFGTVTGMLGAFSTISGTGTEGGGIDPKLLAANIGIALYTTADGLAISIPLLFIMSAINVRLRKLEENVAIGLARFFEAFKEALKRQA